MLERVMRAITASGIVPSAIIGRIMCFSASMNVAHWPLISDAVTFIPDRKSTAARGNPVASPIPHCSASGTKPIPAESWPDGGNANGVPRRPTAKRNASRRPRTKTGIETPRLANSMVPTSIGELRLVADSRPRVAHDRGEGEREQGQLERDGQALDEDLRDGSALPDR